MPFFESRIGPSIFKLYYRHAELVFKTVEHMAECMVLACNDDDTAKAVAATAKAELAADRVKTALRTSIKGRIRLAIRKDVFLEMVARQDRIADNAQNVTEMISFRRLHDDPEARRLVRAHAEAVKATVEEYKHGIETLEHLMESGFARKERDALYERIVKVNILENDADECERQAAGYVFAHGDDAPLAAVHMYRLLQRLDDVANATEHAANALLPVAS